LWPSSVNDLHFSGDGTVCGIVVLGGKSRLLEVEPGREYRTLVAGLEAGRSEHYRADISPDDLLAVGMEDGVRIWGLDTGKALAFLPIGLANSASFTFGKRGRELLSCGPSGLQLWPISDDSKSPGRVRIGAPRTVGLPIAPSVASVGLDGYTAIVTSEKSSTAVVVDLDTETVRCKLAPHPWLSHGVLSPDGRWAATSGWHTPSVKVWDAHTGALAKDLPIGGLNAAFFAPDGRTMITSIATEYRLWDVPAWRAVRELRWEIPSYPGWVAFSPDRKLMALELSPAVVHLVDLATGKTLAKLEDPESHRARWLGFTHDGGRLVTIAPYSHAIHIWDLRGIARQLAGLGLRDEASGLAEIGDTEPARPPKVEILADTSASSGRALEQKARAAIERYRQAVAANPKSSIHCNGLAWSYLTAPEPLRDLEQALAMAQRAVELDPGNAACRNTLGVAYYRAGRYRDAEKILRADLAGQEDRYLAWDFCFLAMSYHRLGETDRAREYRDLALRWSRDQKGLSVEQLHELAAIREEMEALLAK
jgi:WD40 repeat protein/Flp pilus assembly protein TadD